MDNKEDKNKTLYTKLLLLVFKLTLGESSPVSPLICSISAVLRNVANSSCRTFTSPRYMNCRIATRSLWHTSFSITMGCLHGLTYNNDKTYSQNIHTKSD